MSVAPHSGIIDFGTFTPPAGPTDGIQGEVPAPLSGQENYVLSGSGWSSLASLGSLTYQGTWNASTNTPTLVSSVGTQGYYYVVSVAGSTNLNGITTWGVGDWAIFNGTTWQKLEGGTTGNFTEVITPIVSSPTNNLILDTASDITTLRVQDDTSGTPAASTLWVTGQRSGLGRVSVKSSNALWFSSASTNNIQFNTNSSSTVGNDGSNQFAVSNTTSAVNFIQVTGGVTGSPGQVLLTAQGSDANVNFIYRSKGTGNHIFQNSSGNWLFRSANPAGTLVNNLVIAASVTGSSPYITSEGADTNIDLTLITKGTGAVVFNTGNGTQAKVIDTGAATANWVELRGGVTGGSSLIQTWSTGGSAALTFSTRGTSDYSFFSNASGNLQFRIAAAASAVNYVQVTGAATGFTPTISAQGSDSSMGLDITAKNAGAVALRAAGGTNFTAYYTEVAPVNFLGATGSTSGREPILSARGSDTDISMVLQPKGTGTLDVTSAINVSNGNTVTALTRTATGSGYTSIPTITISAPNIAGGVQATATVGQMFAGNTTTIASGGTGYTLNDVITINGGTPSGTAATYTVTGVSGGVITSVTALNFGTYTALPTNPVTVTGGTGTGATLNVVWGIQNVFNITNAGSGYTAQPTVTFSGGGGGSGAAAYATVGGDTTIRSLGNGLNFAMPNQATAFRVDTYSGSAGFGYWQAFGGNSAPILRAIGASAGQFQTNSAVPFQFITAASAEQVRISHTPSTVNYVQLTGSATGGQPAISAQGSDANITLSLSAKGTGLINIQQAANIGRASTNWIQLGGGDGITTSPSLTTTGASTNVAAWYITKGGGPHSFYTNSSNQQFNIAHVASAVNYVQVYGAPTTGAVTIESAGSDANIWFNYGAKGTGRHQFLTNNAVQFQVAHTASADRYVQAQGGQAGVSAPGIGTAGGSEAFDVYSSGNSIRFYTNGKGAAPQVFISHTASAVNYINLTGSATGGGVVASAQGSDANITLRLDSKGGGAISFVTGGSLQAAVLNTGSAVNYVGLTGAATTGSPFISAQGSDTNINLGITSKGTTGSVNVWTNNGGAIQFTVAHTASAVNRLQASGSATTQEPVLSAIGSDTNISLALQSKGTGSIDLASGSTGVNVSNGTTVTAITRTATGNNYTSIPSVAISAPNIAGGVQATASIIMFNSGATIVSGGTGYTVGDTLTVVGGTPAGAAATLTVSTVSAGVITAIAVGNFGSYTTLPTNPVSVTGGTGSGATFNLTYGVNLLTITNAGSGYTSQPTVTFSGGGGSGASAYATVGGNTTIKGLGITTGSSLTFSTPAGDVIKIADAGTTTTNFLYMGTGTTPFITSQGTNAPLALSSNGTGTLWLRSNGAGTNQMAVTHTASAVNYLQVTGGATGSSPIISSQGSDTNINLVFGAKGTGVMIFNANNGEQFRIQNIANAVNNIQVYGQVSGQSPTLISRGSDTNVGLILSSKGTGAIDLNTGNGTAFRASQAFLTGTAVNYIDASGRQTGLGPILSVNGSDTNVRINITSKGNEAVGLYTNLANQLQFNVTHTASAVNYIQVTGSATGSAPRMSVQGSDGTAGLGISAKGGAQIFFQNNGSSNTSLVLNGGTSTVNYVQINASNTTVAPSLQALGNDTNIDLALTPKGTGYVQYGTHTATADTAISGYIEIKDASGTIRKLAVIT